MDLIKNLRPFQIGLLATFAILGVISVILLAGFDVVTQRTVNPYGDKVVIWGTFDQLNFDLAIRAVVDDNDDENFRVVSYQEKDPRTFKNELVNAIAEGRAPDAIILSHEDLVELRSKLQPIPYATLSARTFKDNYLDGFEIFTRSDGVYAVPLAVDPLVMYWNRNILAEAGLAEAPASWEALVNNVAPKVTIRDARRNIVQSTIAFGEYNNIVHAKEVLSSLIMQSGSRLIEEDGRGGYNIYINEPVVSSLRKPVEAALQFYLQFSNPNSALYSWNRSQSDDLQAFIGEKLALYFGMGSNYGRIRELNPNLNFDAAALPQGASATTKRGYGNFYGLAILQSSANKQGTLLALQTLARSASSNIISEGESMAPALRSGISAGSADPFRQMMFNQSLIARGWLEPSPSETDQVLSQMVEDVVSNRTKINTAVSDAIKRLELAY